MTQADEAPPKSGQHIALYGLVGIGNTGNDATLGVALDQLRALMPAATFTIVGCDPEFAAAEFGAPAVAIRPELTSHAALPKPFRQIAREGERWARARAAMRAADCLLVAGTGVFDDFATSPWNYPYRLWQWCKAARAAGKPVKFVSIGAGPIEKTQSMRFFKGAALGADFRSYRDENAKAFARDAMGLDVSKDPVTPDLVFGLAHEAGPPNPTLRTLGVGVMDYHTWRGAKNTDDDVYARYMGQIAEFASGFVKQGVAIRILTGEPSDEPAANDLATRLAPLGGDVTIADIRTLRDVCRAVGQTDAVVATRYHNIVSALICGRPAVSIGYAAKNKAVMSEFGMGEYCQNIWDFDLATLRAHFASVTRDIPAVHASLAAIADARRAEVRAHLLDVARSVTPA